MGTRDKLLARAVGALIMGALLCAFTESYVIASALGIAAAIGAYALYRSRRADS